MGFCSSLFKTFFFIAFCWLGVTLWLFSRLNHELFEHKPPTEARSMKVDMECEGIKVIRKGFLLFFVKWLTVQDLNVRLFCQNLQNPKKLSTRVFPPPLSSPRASQYFILFQISWPSSKLYRLSNHRVSLQT